MYFICLHTTSSRTVLVVVGAPLQSYDVTIYLYIIRIPIHWLWLSRGLSVTRSSSERVRRRVTRRVGRPGKNNKLYFVKTFHAEHKTPFNRGTKSMVVWTESFIRSPCHPAHDACIYLYRSDGWSSPPCCTRRTIDYNPPGRS